MKEKINIVFRKSDDEWSSNDFKYHSHDKFEIYSFHGGDCKYLIGDHIYQLQPGDIIIMNGLTMHRANPSPKEAYERSIIEFSKEWIGPILKSLNVPELLAPFYKSNNSLFRDVDKDTLSEIDELTQKMSACVLQKSSNVEADLLHTRLIESSVATLFVQLLLKINKISQSKLERLSPSQSEKNKHVERVVIWVDKYFNMDISLNNIADSLNISKCYMCRIFKELTGFTIMQYLMNCRLNRAKYFLEMHPNKSITDVSQESGFESSSHFSRYFRQQLKVTPTEYRKRKCNTLSMEVLESQCYYA